MNRNESINKAAETAQFKFGLIAPVIQGLFPDESRTAFYKRIAEKPIEFPDGTVRNLSYKTLEKWVSLYQRDGIDALMPSERSDKGTTRALPDTAIEEIYRLKREFPRLNATQIHARLIREGFIPAVVSVCAVQRFIKRNDLKGARNPNLRDRKAFEEDAFGKMWQADTCYFPYITEDGRSRRVYAICIIDDHSRLIVGAGLFYSDSAANFQAVFKTAVATYGIPAKLYTDYTDVSTIPKFCKAA
jgi:transposase InsO family protein